MTASKTRGFKTPQMIETDIVYGFNKLMPKNNPIYHITITNLNIKRPEELKFQLTNKFFNKMFRYYKYSFEVINYLFVIEYPEKVSRGNMMVDNCEVHTHIVFETTLSIDTIIFFIETTFMSKVKNWYNIERIDRRNDKLDLKNYLIKQINLFTDDNYNYKITDI